MADAVSAVTDKHLLVVFSSSWCPYCRQVIKALEGVGTKPFIVEVDASTKSMLIQKTGKSSVPQVFIGDKYIGGCNDGPERWMGTVPNLRNGNVQKWIAELESARSADVSSIFNVAKPADKDEYAWPLAQHIAKGVPVSATPLNPVSGIGVMPTSINLSAPTPKQEQETETETETDVSAVKISIQWCGG